jgi:hypothetical protein
MKYTNPQTKEVVEIVSVNTASRSFTVKKYADKYAEGVTYTETLPAMNVSSYHGQFFEDLQAMGMFSGFVSENDYKDWPTDSELPEYDANYRISLTSEQVVSVTASETYRSMILDIKQDHIKSHSKGVFIYLTQFNEGHPFLIRYVLGLTIEENPNKAVPEIDYTQPVWYIAPVPETEEPITEEPII